MGNWSRAKVLRLAKGFQGRAKNCYSLAIVRLHRSLQQAYRTRRLKKRNYRKEWIMAINAALSDHSVRYNRFINGLNLYSNIILNRKILAELAINEPYSFKAVVDEVVEQAGIPRVELPKMSYDEAKAQKEIVEKIPTEEVKGPEYSPIRIRPGVKVEDDYLRLSHLEQDEEWEPESKKREQLIMEEIKREQAKKPPKKATAADSADSADENENKPGKDTDKGKGKRDKSDTKGKVKDGDKGKDKSRGDKGDRKEMPKKDKRQADEGKGSPKGKK